MTVDAVLLSEEYVRNGYNFETTTTRPGNESSTSVNVTQSQNGTSGSDDHTDHEGEESLPKKNIWYAMPAAFDLNTSGLRYSKRIQEQNKKVVTRASI